VLHTDTVEPPGAGGVRGRGVGHSETGTAGRTIGSSRDPALGIDGDVGRGVGARRYTRGDKGRRGIETGEVAAGGTGRGKGGGYGRQMRTVILKGHRLHGRRRVRIQREGTGQRTTGEWQEGAN